jgi:hypothetical protein
VTHVVAGVSLAYVRFGSEEDTCGAKSHVGFAPDFDRKSGRSQRVMSALPLRAEFCSASTLRFSRPADLPIRAMMAIRRPIGSFPIR